MPATADLGSFRYLLWMGGRMQIKLGRNIDMGRWRWGRRSGSGGCAQTTDSYTQHFSAIWPIVLRFEVTLENGGRTSHPELSMFFPLTYSPLISPHGHKGDQRGPTELLGACF